MKEILKSWKLYLTSGIICIFMIRLSSVSACCAGASARSVPVILLECLTLFLLISLLLAALAGILRSFESTLAFLAFLTTGMLWAPAVASPFLGMDCLTVFRIENLFSVFSAEGRPVSGWLLMILKDFGWFSLRHVNLFMAAGVFVLAIGMTFLWNACLRQTRFTSIFDKVLLGAGIGSVFFAPLMVIVQSFPALMLPWLGGVAALIFAVVLMMNGKGWSSWLPAFLLVCLCTNIYQTFVGFFIPLALICAASAHGVYDEQGRLRWKKFLSFFAGLCLIVIVSLGVSFFCAKILSPALGNANVRAVGHLDLLGNIKELLRSLRPVYFDLFGVFFPGFLPLSVAFFAGVIVFYDHWRIQRIPLLFMLFLSLAMLFCTSILLQLFVSEVWINDRAAIPCSASAGLAAFAVLFFIQGDALPCLFRKMAAALVCVWLVAAVYSNIRIAIRMHESNVCDYYEAREFLRKVENYERQNRVSVETIEIHYRPHYSSRNKPGNYPCAESTEKLEQDTKLFCIPWKITPYFEHYFNRRFKVKRNPVHDPSTIQRWGKDKRWDDSNYDEQLVFEGSTVHILNF